MDDRRIPRRDFIRNGSLLAAVTLAETLARAKHAGTKPGDMSKILNYTPKMGYRRLGKTNLMISEVSLGGHWRAPWRDRSGGCGRYLDGISA